MNKKYLDSLNDPFLLRWEKANIVWFGKDKTLTKEAHFVHQKLLKKKINTKSQIYWDLIDTHLYRTKKDKLKKYFSFNN